MPVKCALLTRVVRAMYLLPLLCGTAFTPAIAQDTTQPATSASTVVDESALRYFARQGDEQRLQAEIARLSAIYPAWVPPADPLATETAVDEDLQKMWDLYGTGDIAGVQAAIAARTAADPTWRPPADLSTALLEGSAASEIRRASTALDYPKVISIAATHPELLVCGNVDLIWRVAEAFVDTGRDTRGVDAYTFILQNCSDSAERLATMQKAGLLLDSASFDNLFQYEKTDAAGVGEFATVRLDVARRSISELLDGVSRRVDPEAVTALETAVATKPSADDFRLLGYYELKSDRARQARKWFEEAQKLDPSAQSASGLALAMIGMNDPAEAETVLSDYRFDTPELGEQYLSAANALLTGEPPKRIEPDVLDRIIESTSDLRDATTAHNMGWYAYNFQQTTIASQWFEQALQYDPTYEPAAYGLLVASQKLRDRSKMREIMSQWGPVSPRIQLFGKPGAPTTAPVRFDNWSQPAMLQNAVFRPDSFGAPAFMLVAELTANQKRAAQQCSSLVPPESMSPNAALPRAWCLMDLGRNAEAQAAFARATQSASEATRTEAYYGQTLALLRLGLVEDAAVSAAAMPQTSERVREMQISILTTTATTYFNLGRYEEVLQLLDQRAMLAPEQNDLLTIRGWCYFHLGRTTEGRRIFAAVAAAGYPDAQRALDSTRPQ